MTVAALERTNEARMASLMLANEVRFTRARMKQQLRAGDVDAVDLLADPPWWLRSMKVSGLLVAMPRFGVSRVRRMMRIAAVSDAKTVGGMSERQRRVLTDVIEATRA